MRPDTAVRYLHLAPAEVWVRQVASGSYRPEGYDVDGFVHLTIGDDNLVAVGNRYYASDRREQVVLEIDPALLVAPVRFGDPDRRYPHLYGPLNVDAVVAVWHVRRALDGNFIAVEPRRLSVPGAEGPGLKARADRTKSLRD